MKHHQLLDCAKREWASGDLSGSLNHLLELWRESRDESIAALCEAISMQLERNLPRLPTGGKRDAMQRTWLATESARDPKDLPRLIRALSETYFRSTDALVRAKRLIRWPADPRATACLIEQLAHPQFSGPSARPFWLAVFDLVRRQGDPRAPAALIAYASRTARIFSQRHRSTAPWFRARALELAKQLESAVSPTPSPSSPLRTRAQAWLTRVEQSEAERTRLLEAVLAEPNDDARRHVYADFLLTANDPRGELIALQLAKADAEKVVALLSKHEREWLGSLSHITAVAKWQKGFPSSIVVAETNKEAIADCVGDLNWATVREVQIDWSPAAQRLILHPVMRSLEALNTTPDVASAPALPIRILRLGGEFDVALAKRLSRSRSFAQVRHLSFWPERRQGRRCAGLDLLSWANQLATVGIAVHSHRYPVGETLSELSVRKHVQHVVFEFPGDEWGIRALRTKRGWRLEVHSSTSWASNVIEMIEQALGAGVEAVVMESPLSKALHKRLVTSLEKSAVLYENRGRSPQRLEVWRTTR